MRFDIRDNGQECNYFASYSVALFRFKFSLINYAFQKEYKYYVLYTFLMLFSCRVVKHRFIIKNWKCPEDFSHNFRKQTVYTMKLNSFPFGVHLRRKTQKIF